MSHTLVRLSQSFAVCKTEVPPAMPSLPSSQSLSSVCFADGEWTLVLPEDHVPDTVAAIENGWACFKVVGPFPFDTVGVLADLLSPLKVAGVPVFVLSTYATDYIMVKSTIAGAAASNWKRAGHEVVEPSVDESSL